MIHCERKKEAEEMQMTIKELTELVAWVTKNSRRKLTEEEKAWAKMEIDKAETFRDLAKAVLAFARSGN